MCHFLPVYYLGIVFLGPVEGQNITSWLYIWSSLLSQNSREFYKSPCLGRIYIYHWIVWSNFNLLLNSQWITLRIQSCLAFYSFFDSLLYSGIMWLTVSSLSSHNLQFLFSFISLIFAIISLLVFYTSMGISAFFYQCTSTFEKSLPKNKTTRIRISI